jgi:hypothetical protein
MKTDIRHGSSAKKYFDFFKINLQGMIGTKFIDVNIITPFIQSRIGT